MFLKLRDITIYLPLFFFAFLTFRIEYSSYQYIIALYLLILLSVSLILNPKIDYSNVKLIDWLPALMIITWVYGIFIALLNGNEINFIFRNFAGMTLYFIYYLFLRFNLDIDKLIKIIFVVSLIFLFDGIIGFVKNINIYTNYSFLLENIGFFRVYYSVGVLFFYSFISIILANILLQHKEFNSPIKLLNKKTSALALLALFIFVGNILTVSKGYLLSLLYIFFLYLYLSLSRVLKTFKISPISLFLLILGLSSFILLQNSSIIDVIYNSFSLLDTSNMTRSIQSNQILSEITFFGLGMGASFEIDLMRDDKLLYASELSYQNLVHKLGILSIVPLSIFVYTILVSFKNLGNNKNIFLSAFALGGMSYLLPAYGNPLLFGAMPVFFHCLILYAIRISIYGNNKYA